MLWCGPCSHTPLSTSTEPAAETVQLWIDGCSDHRLALRTVGSACSSLLRAEGRVFGRATSPAGSSLPAEDDVLALFGASNIRLLPPNTPVRGNLLASSFGSVAQAAPADDIGGHVVAAVLPSARTVHMREPMLCAPPARVSGVDHDRTLNKIAAGDHGRQQRPERCRREIVQRLPIPLAPLAEPAMLSAGFLMSPKPRFSTTSDRHSSCCA